MCKPGFNTAIYSSGEDIRSPSNVEIDMSRPMPSGGGNSVVSDFKRFCGTSAWCFFFGNSANSTSTYIICLYHSQWQVSYLHGPFLLSLNHRQPWNPLFAFRGIFLIKQKISSLVLNLITTFKYTDLILALPRIPTWARFNRVILQRSTTQKAHQFLRAHSSKLFSRHLEALAWDIGAKKLLIKELKVVSSLSVRTQQKLSPEILVFI